MESKKTKAEKDEGLLYKAFRLWFVLLFLTALVFKQTNWSTPSTTLKTIFLLTTLIIVTMYYISERKYVGSTLMDKIIRIGYHFSMLGLVIFFIDPTLLEISLDKSTVQGIFHTGTLNGLFVAFGLYHGWQGAKGFNMILKRSPKEKNLPEQSSTNS